MKFLPIVVTTLLGFSNAATFEDSIPSENEMDTNRYLVTMESIAAIPEMSRLKIATVGRGKWAVIELDSEELKEKFAESEIELYPDALVYPFPVKDSGNDNKNFLASSFAEVAEELAAQETPWGINKVFLKNGSPDIPSTMPTEVKTVCIIDSGYQRSHPDLVDTATAADSSQASPNSSLYYGTDGCKHGTHVAGTVVGSDNDQGVIGVFPGASVKVVRTFGDNCQYAYVSQLLSAIDKCADVGADIVSMSLGSSFNFPGLGNGIADYTSNDDMLFIAAAGNGGNSAYSYPAGYSAVMGVGATSESDQIAYFSQYNDQVDISGPGVGVRSTTGTSSYSSYSGTSMATPHVAGVALLLWNKYPACTTSEIRDALEKGATDKGTPGKDNFYGYGIVNYWASFDYLSTNGCAASVYDGPTTDGAPGAGEPNEWFSKVFLQN